MSGATGRGASARGARAGRSKGLGSFSMLIHAYFQSPQYAALSPRAVKLLVDLLCQYRGNNNGDLCASWKLMKPLGWTSKSQLAKALAELTGQGWVIQSRQGGRHKASLHALTMFSIDLCDGKLDQGIKAEPHALHLWKRPTSAQPRKQSARGLGKLISLPLRTGQLCPSVRGNEASAVVELPLRTGQS